MVQQHQEFEVATIGYQGRSIDDFIAALKESDVTTVIDVRSRPMSRRHEYSKRRLMSTLESAGLEYMHLPQLGMPLDLLDKRDPKTGNAEILGEYRTRFCEHGAPVGDLMDLLQGRKICLLCYEQNHQHCHRGVLADLLGDQVSIMVEHL